MIFSDSDRAPQEIPVQPLLARQDRHERVHSGQVSFQENVSNQDFGFPAISTWTTSWWTRITSRWPIRWSPFPTTWVVWEADTTPRQRSTRQRRSGIGAFLPLLPRTLPKICLNQRISRYDFNDSTATKAPAPQDPLVDRLPYILVSFEKF